MHRFTRATWALGALIAATAVAACQDELVVENRNNPNRGTVLALPRDVEGLTSRIYQSIFSAHFGAQDNLDNQLKPAAFENVGAVANFGLQARSGIPRAFADNSIGNATNVGNRRDYAGLVTAAGTAITVLERLYADGFTLGAADQDARSKSFAWFTHGVALGDVALAYDSSAIPRLGVVQASELPLAGYDSVMRVALRSLDSALVYAQTASPIPTEWLRTTAALPAGANGEYTRLIRSYRARLRAGVARSAADREAVDWNAVIADATSGITTDYVVQLTGASGGWDWTWAIQHFIGVSWHQMTPYVIGMADSSGGYDAWLATPRDSRAPFVIRTRDARFPVGDTREAQQLQTAQGTLVNLRPGQYFTNRSANDPSGTTWANSQYDHNRWRANFNNSRIGPWTMFPKVENDMLAAEGYIRTGNVAAAVVLINLSRVRNNLPAIAGTVSALGQPVPGGQACVPRVPDAARGFTATKCGDVYEAMKWEKRMETAYVGWGQWYFDSRGWNDLPPGTPIQWPVPYQELQARILPIYSLGGVGLPGGAPNTNTYGFGTTNNL